MGVARSRSSRARGPSASKSRCAIEGTRILSPLVSMLVAAFSVELGPMKRQDCVVSFLDLIARGGLGRRFLPPSNARKPLVCSRPGVVDLDPCHVIAAFALTM